MEGRFLADIAVDEQLQAGLGLERVPGVVWLGSACYQAVLGEHIVFDLGFAADFQFGEGETGENQCQGNSTGKYIGFQHGCSSWILYWPCRRRVTPAAESGIDQRRILRSVFSVHSLGLSFGSL